ncbi:hypothetical protein [Prevotella disiens]|uniref:hypothetical protein n=1 Tax=Prevotella disiens TaxID=28130 RepID=UPI0015F3384C|nr:hypothetical protein [Prevotella disiens]
MSAAKFVHVRGEKSHFSLRTISLSQTKRANERSEIRTRSWREIALFIKNKKMRKHS